MSGATRYAVTAWTPLDVKTLRPSWTIEKCEDELGKIEKYLQDRVTELGWEVLDTLLDQK